MFRKARFRLFVRKCCNKQQQRALFGDDSLLDAALESASERYERSASGNWQDFFEWLLEHADEIIAVITKIISLFAAPATEASANG